MTLENLRKGIILLLAFLMFFSSAQAGTVTRQFDKTTILPDGSLVVTLTVDVTGETFYAIDETIPSGWTLLGLGSGLTESLGHIKCVIIEGASDTTYNYTLKAPGQWGVTTFGGEYMFEGMAMALAIGGQKQVTVGGCTTDSQCPNGICCNGVCVQPFCSSQADCGTGHICINPSTCQAQCVIGCEENSNCLPMQICYLNACVDVECFSDSDCDDAQALTIDTCLDPGTVNAMCDYTSIECNSSLDCDDSDSSTRDACQNSGTVQAQCTHTTITECLNEDDYCPLGCSSSNDSDCISVCGNGNVDAGETCGNCPQDVKCSAGELCCNDACVLPACNADSDCDDAKQCTTDTCKNPGTCSSQCFFKKIPKCKEPDPNPPVDEIFLEIEGSCLNIPLRLNVTDYQGKPLEGVTIELVKDRAVMETRVTDSTGKLSYLLTDQGQYTFYATKEDYLASSKRTMVKTCKAPQVTSQESLYTGEQQLITVVAEDGNIVKDYEIKLTYPDNTTKMIKVEDDIAYVPVTETGTYTATVETGSYSQSISFQAQKPMQLIPPLDQDQKTAVKTLFGEDTAETPNYLLLWILAIAVISGLIIYLTRIKPPWFRAFMAVSYTLFPLVVNMYSNSLWLAFIAIAIQTLILMALLFNQANKEFVKRKPAA